VLEVCRKYGFEVYATYPALEASALLGPGSVTTALLQQHSITSLWWLTSLARTLIAAESASSFLEQFRQPLERCGDAAVRLENVLSGFIDQPTALGWGEVTEAVANYLSTFSEVIDRTHHFNINHITTFLEELRRIQPLITTSLEQNTAVSSLPETSLLFRKMSGSPMMSWVLWKTEPSAPYPFFKEPET
jgi:hypothetical protein